MPSKSHRRVPHSLRRKQSKKRLPPKILVFCEGGTEKQILEDLRIFWRIANVRIKVVGQVGVPMTVVKSAKLERPKKRDKKAYQTDIWVVFDRDTHPNWREAIVEAKGSGLKLADSNPCIELWGILLHHDQTAFISHTNAEAYLATIHKGYSHKKNPYLDPITIQRYFQNAGTRADSINQLAKEKGDEHGNPSTRFHNLVNVFQSVRL